MTDKPRATRNQAPVFAGESIDTNNCPEKLMLISLVDSSGSAFFHTRIPFKLGHPAIDQPGGGVIQLVNKQKPNRWLSAVLAVLPSLLSGILIFSIDPDRKS